MVDLADCVGRRVVWCTDAFDGIDGCPQMGDCGTIIKADPEDGNCYAVEWDHPTVARLGPLIFGESVTVIEASEIGEKLNLIPL